MLLCNLHDPLCLAWPSVTCMTLCDLHEVLHTKVLHTKWGSAHNWGCILTEAATIIPYQYYNSLASIFLNNSLLDFLYFFYLSYNACAKSLETSLILLTSKFVHIANILYGGTWFMFLKGIHSFPIINLPSAF